ncbi:hypothetical protein B0T16DRAFT_206987 [Cercophora newfieldiana]|uniref:Secreted protein n=1 Tax=Cercophora newfieldiana TaxID=92897 RepID=A0AA40CJD4_9PEZI|nr:hypothetical protein B0T16DRAFT_206987 [Cercophora newfieldiana]
MDGFSAGFFLRLLRLQCLVSCSCVRGAVGCGKLASERQRCGHDLDTRCAFVSMLEEGCLSCYFFLCGLRFRYPDRYPMNK